ncbi:hypothetical protein NM688_g7185 [Phlebia brevispora]|uniref:Uncharacterized protein n=1 Tax=Phlebia brevispora TaxID=194682 RepID=A0ACC1S840_9APHY|nr:hypothetical protein NM688_g7185 [Phlebia brevispora]
MISKDLLQPSKTPGTTSDQARLVPGAADYRPQGARMATLNEPPNKNNEDAEQQNKEKHRSKENRLEMTSTEHTSHVQGRRHANSAGAGSDSSDASDDEDHSDPI